MERCCDRVIGTLIGSHWTVLITWPDARERNGVLADEIAADKLVVQDDEPNERHFGMVDIELEALLEYGAVSFIRNRPRFPLCAIPEIRHDDGRHI